MKKRTIFLAWCIGWLLLSIWPVNAQSTTASGFGCTTDLECLENFGSGYSCVSNICRQISSKDIVKGQQQIVQEQEETRTVVEQQAAETKEGISQVGAQVQQQQAAAQRGFTDLGSQLDIVEGEVKGTQAALEERTALLQSQLSTGLATLQQSTQEDIQRIEELLNEQQAAERQRRVLYFILIAVVVALAVTAIIFAKSQERKKQQELVRYIERALKRGATFSALQERLTGLGWNKEDISTARQTLIAQRSTVRSSPASASPSVTAAKTAAPSSGPSPPPEGAPNPRKMLALMLIGVVALFGLFIILRQTGILAGHAIAFGDIQSEADLGTYIKETLDTSVARNEFYPLLSALNACIQVESDVGSVSFNLRKSGTGHTIKKAAISCENDQTYDLAVKFTDPQVFDQLSRQLTCETIGQAHQREAGRVFRGMVVLPSKYILPGFTFNARAPPLPFCDALLTCLTFEELLFVGVDCSGDAPVGSRPALEGPPGIIPLEQIPAGEVAIEQPGVSAAGRAPAAAPLGEEVTVVPSTQRRAVEKKTIITGESITQEPFFWVVAVLAAAVTTWAILRRRKNK